jgi:alkylated DNA nucleotide flippase Atl1
MSESRAKLDLDAAAAFLETVPIGRWTSYGDVAMAAGRTSRAGQGVASWIGSKGQQLANVHRVLNGHGEINAAWAPAGPGLPADARAVARLLEREGVRFSDGQADPAQRWHPPSADTR